MVVKMFDAVGAPDRVERVRSSTTPRHLEIDTTRSGVLRDRCQCVPPSRRTGQNRGAGPAVGPDPAFSIRLAVRDPCVFLF